MTKGAILWKTGAEWSVEEIEVGDPRWGEVTVQLAAASPPAGARLSGPPGVRAGETVVVMGAGGVGMNAVQGAAAAGARHVVVVDPAEPKRTWAPGFGASHVFASVDEARGAHRPHLGPAR